MVCKAVLFDLDDTLLWDERSVKEAFEATCRAAREQVPHLDTGKLEEAVRREARALYESYETFPFTQMIGINPFEALWAKFSGGTHPMFRKLEQLAPAYRVEAWTRGLRAEGVDDPALGEQLALRFADERRARPLVYDDTFPALDALKPNVKLLLLTNGAPDLQWEKINGISRLAGYFDHIVISGEFGEGKPAVSIFEHALKLLGVQPDEAIMVGDKLTTDILGSNRAGIPNAWLNRDNKPNPGDIMPRHVISNLHELVDLVTRTN